MINDVTIGLFHDKGTSHYHQTIIHIHKCVGMFSSSDNTIHHYFTINPLILTMLTQQIPSQGHPTYAGVLPANQKD